MYPKSKVIAFILALVIVAADVKANDGEQLFKRICAACHTIGQGRLVGPDLSGVNKKRNQEWLIPFIKSSYSVISSGDPDAVSIFNEYNNLRMPDNDLTDVQITAVLKYIEQYESSSAEVNMIAVDILAETDFEDIVNGLNLFSGNKPLTNNGAACTSCHKVRDDRIFSSGTLAKDLTRSYDIMGSAGIAAILRSPPFPAMSFTYQNHLLTEEEVIDLTAYLRSVSKERYYQVGDDFSITFALLGIFVFIIIFMITIILYFNRKRYAVNKSIFDRQSKAIH